MSRNSTEIKELTFKVNTRRNKKTYPMQSMEVSNELGGVILDTCPEYEGRCTQS